MGVKDRSLIDKINPTLIALIAMAIDHCLSVWKQVHLGSCQRFVQEVEHNVSAIQETLKNGLIMFALIYFVVLALIFVLSRQTFKPKKQTIFAG